MPGDGALLTRLAERGVRGCEDLVGERELERCDARLGESVDARLLGWASTGAARSVRLEEPFVRLAARSVDDDCDKSVVVSPLAPTGTPLAQREMSSRLERALIAGPAAPVSRLRVVGDVVLLSSRDVELRAARSGRHPPGTPAPPVETLDGDRGESRIPLSRSVGKRSPRPDGLRDGDAHSPIEANAVE